MKIQMFTSLLAISFFLAGCAAQSAQKRFLEAENALHSAQKTGDKRAKDAEADLVSGKEALSEARYDLAIKKFDSSLKISKEINSQKIRPKKTAAAAKNADKATTEKQPPSTDEQVQALVGKPTAPPERKLLPKQALAKYLAGKRSPNSSATPFPSPTPAGKKAAAAKKPVVAAKKALPTPIVKAATPIPAPSVAPTPPPPPPSPKDSNVVEAPAKPSLKVPPTLPPKPEDEAEVNLQVPAPVVLEKPKVPEGAELAPPTKSNSGKRKIPGTLQFKEGDPSLAEDARTNLDQISKYLLENPSTTLVLQGTTGTGEKSNILDARYESMKSYLVNKGVPEDQISMDSDRRGGTSAEFTMFVIEH